MEQTVSVVNHTAKGKTKEKKILSDEQRLRFNRGKENAASGNPAP